MAANPIINAVIIFTDIRGFTGWADANEVFPKLDDFIRRFDDLIQQHFSPRSFFVKRLGDGAMIVQEIASQEVDDQAQLATKLANILLSIKRVDKDFTTLCKAFGQKVGHRTDLQLGWSVVRGHVVKVNDDYVGSNVNKAARLCDIARPFGIVVDTDDFPSDPSAPELGLRFYTQTRPLSGLDAASVWVTEEIQFQFVPREQLRQSPEVHVAGLCIADQEDGLRILLARRSDKRRLYPGKIEGCGGQLAPNESFTGGVQRHFRLELGLKVRVLTDCYCLYEIRQEKEPIIPGIRFLCELSEDQKPSDAPNDSPNHSKVWWATEYEFNQIPAAELVGELKPEALALIQKYRQQKPRPKQRKQQRPT